MKRWFAVPMISALALATVGAGLATSSFAAGPIPFSSAVFTEAFLSFFGLGWKGPGAVESWGQIANEAYTNLALLRGLWLYFAPPGIFITLVVLGFAMLGYGLEEVLNPALKRRR